MHSLEKLKANSVWYDANLDSYLPRYFGSNESRFASYQTEFSLSFSMLRISPSFFRRPSCVPWRSKSVPELCLPRKTLRILPKPPRPNQARQKIFKKLFPAATSRSKRTVSVRLPSVKIGRCRQEGKAPLSLHGEGACVYFRTILSHRRFCQLRSAVLSRRRLSALRVQLRRIYPPLRFGAFPLRRMTVASRHSFASR